MSSDAYYLRSRGKVLGPFPLERLQAMKSRGQLGRTHQVSTDRQSWVAAAAVPELFGAPSAVEFEPFDLPAPEPHAAGAGIGNAGLPASGGPAVSAAAWYYHVAGQQFGPVSAMEIRRLLSAGELGSDDMVWREGMESWSALQDVPELRPRSAMTPAATADGGAAAVVPTSGLAVASLVLGIVSLFLPCVGLIPGLLAVIFGGVSLGQVNRSRGRLGGKGMAIAGLVTGLVTLSLYGVYLLLVVLGTIAAPASTVLDLPS